MYRDLICQEIKFKGHNNDECTAYYARPAGNGPFPGVAFIHHIPGWNEVCIETIPNFLPVEMTLRRKNVPRLRMMCFVA